MTGGSYHLWQRTPIIVAVVKTVEDRVSTVIVRGGREAGSVPSDVSCCREESERDESGFERPCLRLRRYRSRAAATTINNAAKTPSARPTAAPALSPGLGDVWYIGIDTGGVDIFGAATPDCDEELRAVDGKELEDDSNMVAVTIGLLVVLFAPENCVLLEV